MKVQGTWCAATALLVALTASVLLLPDADAQTPKEQKDQKERKETPKFSFVLKNRHGHATPSKTRAAHTAGGNTDVQQPSDDRLVFTMTGVATAAPYPTTDTGAAMDFDLNQEFAIAAADPKQTAAKLIVEAQVIGLLRGDKHGGSASVGCGNVAVFSGTTSILALSIDAHSVAGEDHLAINDRKGPVGQLVTPAEFHLMQTFRINASHGRGICGTAAAAEFAPEGLEKEWIAINDPFRGANKKEFGFRVVLRLEPE